VPVIMLTAMHELAMLRDSFAMGADDFVAKPFSTLELIARIRAKLRRCERDTPGKLYGNQRTGAKYN